MRRFLPLLAVALMGAAAGAATTAAVQDGGTDPTVPLVPTMPSASTAATPPPGATAATAASSGPQVLLAWAQGGLPAAAVDAARSMPGVNAVAVVRAGRADLVGSVDADGAPVDALEPGWQIPLDVAAVDPATYAAVVPAVDRAVVAALEPGEAILGATSAVLRRLGPGARLDLAGDESLTVVAVVPDASIGAAEVVVDVGTGERLGVGTPRAAFIAFEGDRAAVERGVAAGAGGTPVRFRAPGETPYLRAADGILPQSLIKEAYGEFAYRPLGDGVVEIDPAWVDATIVEADVPILGEVRCHRAIVDALTDAMAAAVAAGLADVVEAAGFDGCFVPRLVRNGSSMSRHAWGVAFDIGYSDNPTTAVSAQDDRVVELLRDGGFTWGGTWLIPDPAHFEVVARPM